MPPLLARLQASLGRAKGDGDFGSTLNHINGLAGRGLADVAHVQHRRTGRQNQVELALGVGHGALAGGANDHLRTREGVAGGVGDPTVNHFAGDGDRGGQGGALIGVGRQGGGHSGERRERGAREEMEFHDDVPNAGFNPDEYSRA